MKEHADVHLVVGFMDFLKQQSPKCGSDAALGRRLGMNYPDISKLRAGIKPFGPNTIMRVHQEYNLSIREIKAFLGLRCLGRVSCERS